MSTDQDTNLPSGRTAGITIAVGSLLTVAMMLHHPHAHSHTTAEFVEEMREVAWLNQFVHGSMIVLLGVLLYGFSCLSSRLGRHQGWVRAGLIAYGLGSLAMMVAATASGFVVTRLAFAYHDAPPESLDVVSGLFRLCRAINQASANIGVVGMSLGIVLWSMALLTRSMWLHLVPILGILVGGGLLVAMLSGHLRMDLHGALAFVVLHTVWSLAVATELIRRRL